jgi:DNA-binding XRE family transcriptional regulator
MDALPFCRATLDGVRCPIGPYLATVKGYPANPRSIGEAIRKRRLDLGLRQVDVAEIIGCNEMTVVNWEQDYTNPRGNHMPRVIKFLGVPVAEARDQDGPLRIRD